MNRILKQRARQLYGRNFGRLLLVYLLNLAYLLLTTMFPLQLQNLLERRGMDSWSSFFIVAMVQMALMVLLAPVSLGITRYVYLLQTERGPRVRDVFYYFTGAGRYGKAVMAGILQSFPSYLVLICASFMDGTGSEALEMALLLLTILGYGFVLYWSLHICLLPYILVEDEEAELGHIRRESFRLMQGNCGRYFGLCFSFVGWYLLITAIVSVVLVAAMMPTILRYVDMGLTPPESTMENYIVWAELAIYFCMTFLSPYIALACAGFGDAALRGQLEQLAWQGRAPYGGYPNTTGWQQPGYPPQWQQPPYPPQYPQGGPYGQGWGAGPNTTSWQNQPGWGQPQQPQQPQSNPYTAAQQEEAAQYERYRQGQPMAARTFTCYGSTNDPGNFLPWPQVERSDLYSFLKLEGWMPGMVTAAWQQAAAGMASQARGTGAVVKRSVTESLGGTRFSVTVILSENPGAGCWQVCIQIELSPGVQQNL